jgi:translation initiation factor 1
MSSTGRLVYSSDPELNRKCQKCKEVVSECTCEPDVDPKATRFIAKLRIEKQGRGGKTVTIIDDLPKNEIYLKELTKFIKNKCGTGGTYLMSGKEGIIEIQGDRIDAIRTLLDQRKIQHKGGGR